MRLTVHAARQSCEKCALAELKGHERLRQLILKDGTASEGNVRPSLPSLLRRPSISAFGARWHLDEIVSKIGGERVWIRRAVDDEGEVMDMIVHKRRDAGRRFDCKVRHWIAVARVTVIALNVSATTIEPRTSIWA